MVQSERGVAGEEGKLDWTGGRRKMDESQSVQGKDDLNHVRKSEKKSRRIPIRQFSLEESRIGSHLVYQSMRW